MASIGALFVMSRSRPATLFSATFASGDVIALIAMFGWSAYTLLQTRVGAALSNLARVCVFAFAGALFSLPPACGRETANCDADQIAVSLSHVRVVPALRKAAPGTAEN
jgi:drug/metabolite transporter (DMT)-like permease